MDKWLSYVLVLLLGVAGGAWFTHRYCPRMMVEERRDTTIVRDTIRVESPPEVRREVLETTIRVEVRDTIREKDTLYIRLPMERREYRGEDYYAEVTGYEPRLTRIEVYPETRIITERIVPDWRFNGFIGIDYIKGKDLYIVPNIGAEIAWKRISAHAEVGMMIHKEIEPYLGIGVRYDIIHR